MGNIIYRNNIIELLEAKIKYKGLKLPSYVDFQIDNKLLFIALGSHNSKNGEVFSCAVNLQTDEAAFEGWSICLKHHLRHYIDRVVLSWIKPDQMTGRQLLHYNRFAYRVVRFKQMFDWFAIADINEQELSEFENELSKLVINTPLNEASMTSDESSKEKQIEYEQRNLEYLKRKFQLQNINHQLPVGVKKNNISFFTGGPSAIDIWGIDNQGNLNIFELKFKNKKVGIISELLFYSEVMYDLFVTKKIRPPAKASKIRNAELLYGSASTSIKAIKSHFLFDELHPMAIGTNALINTNNFGIKFFNSQYELISGTFIIDKVYYKGAMQSEEELKQASFRMTSRLTGHKHILKIGDENLHESIRDEAKHYFQENDIAWWKYGNNSDRNPTNHMVSSQIQCLNHLFSLRKDKESTLKLAQLFDPEIEDVLRALTDYESGYIAFEFIYENDKLLNEKHKQARRGSFCTSIDAFIIALKRREKVLIPIEWKYTEKYFEFENKAFGGENNKYSQLIRNSAQLKPIDELAHSCCFYEPFYELMRQTLLVEQMVRTGVASDFLHVMVVPFENNDLLDNNYTFTKDDLQTTWYNCLYNKGKFKIVDSKQIRQVIENLPGYEKLADYLKSRY
jgi:hypothetical protein